MHRGARTAALIGLLFVATEPLRAQQHLVIAAASDKTSGGEAREPRQLSPEEKMQKRFPQPVRVGDLIGLPLLDDNDRAIGYVKFVVRTSADKIQLIIPYGGLLGWRQRLVPVPIEVVAIAGRQLAALDMTRAEFDRASAWDESQTKPIGPDEVIRIGLYKR